MAGKKPEKKAFIVRVRETVLHDYDVEAENEQQARDMVHALATSPPMIVDTIDWEVQSVEKAA